MKYIDIHCHLDFPDYGNEFPEVLARMKEKEVGAITIGTDLESSKRAVEIAEKNEGVWACIGVHPTSELRIMNYELWEELILNPKVVGVGECGLDFFRIDPDKLEVENKIQTEIFESQIQFALKYNKPLMLHCRNAYDEVLGILQSYKKEFGQKLRGNCHFFAGSIDQAKKFLDLEFSMSFTGVITFSNDLARNASLGSTSMASGYNEVIRYLPLNSIMSETDAPFVAPVPYRGKRNEPSFVIEVVKKIAEIKGQDYGIVSKTLIKNAQKMFGIDVSRPIV